MVVFWYMLKPIKSDIKTDSTGLEKFFSKGTKSFHKSELLRAHKSLVADHCLRERITNERSYDLNLYDHEFSKFSSGIACTYNHKRIYVVWE